MMTVGRTVVGLWLLGASLLRAAEPARVAPAEPIVILPPLVVSGEAGSATWLYANVQGEEYLSRCSPKLTRAFIQARLQSLQRLRAVVPDAFLAAMPTLLLLQDQDVAPKSGDTVGRELLGEDKLRAVSAPPTGPVKFLPNLRLDDRDLTAAFAYLDENKFSQTDLAISASNLRFLLERRTPMLPPWLVEGLIAVHEQIEVTAAPITLRPFVWLSPAESAAIILNPARPRALLASGEMFAPDALRGEGNHHPDRVRTLQAQVGLFVRWALDPRNQMREAFWAFAQRASEQRVSEDMFFQCFGFGFSDLRDRLSDYLPLALKEPLRLYPGGAANADSFEIREATAGELARLRGTWERLEFSYVQRTQPAFAESYKIQARRTLRRAYERGDNEPGLVAENGLYEIDAGAPGEALPFLEKAVAAGVNRPRPYVELARLRLTGLTRGQTTGRLFSTAEIAPVVEPLRRALRLPPELPEAYGMLADVWVRSHENAPPEDVEALARGARLFALNPAVSYRLALALARCGRRTEAGELLTTGIDYVPDDAARARYQQLLTALTRPAATTK